MTVFKCKMCGANLEFAEGSTVAKCKYCGTQQTLPRLTNDRRANLYDRANHFRRNNEFDKAMAIYETILNEDGTDAEAYWSLVLCRYGIEYVEDPASHRHIPTVNRTQYTSIYDDDNYRSALQYADEAQRQVYEAEAKTINDIQKGILAISQKEEPFDVFICYKETDRDGRRTHDSVLAQELYYGLKEEGFKVFFSRITLEDKLGTAYEPYIFAALNSAKVMVVLGTHPDYFNAVWVKNEWSRFLSLIKQGKKKTLIPAYRDMDPYDLPEEFSHLQAQDMAKLGFMQDLIRGIKKILKASTPKPAAVIKETVTVQNAVNVAPLLQRAFLFLEDGDWNDADEQLEKVLDADPENAQAYVGKLMAELHIKKQSMLEACEKPFDENHHYLKAVRFADPALKTALEGYTERIRTRAKQAQQESIHARKKRTKKLALILTPLLCLLIAGAVVLNYVLIPKLSTDPNDDTPPTVTPEATDTEVAGATITEPEVTPQAPENTTTAPQTTTQHTHGFGAWSVVTNATCTESGIQQRTCACGETETQEIAAMGHAQTIDAAKPATCTETGLTEGSHCSVCKTVLVEQQTVALQPHTPVTDVAVPATCTKEGLSEGSHCSVCKTVLTKQQPVALTSHTPVTDAAVPATCTETGLTEGSHCSVCQTVLAAQQTVGLLPHTPVTDEAKAATCAEAGLTEGSHCSSCNTVFVAQETIEPLPHTVVTDPGVAATETATGLTEGSHCSVCSTVLVAQEVIPQIYSDGLEYEIKNGTVTITGIGTCTDTNLRIPATIKGVPVTKIGFFAFKNCSFITSVVIPEGVTTIDHGAFASCTSLIKIVLPDSITELKWNAVNTQNTKVRGTYYEGGNYIGPPSNPYMMLIGVLTTSVTEFTIHPDTKVIGSYSCRNLTKLQAVTIPEGVRAIGAYAFSHCESLTEIAVPSTVEDIGESPFGYCNALVSLTVDAQNPAYHSSGNCIIETASKTLISGCNTSVIPDDGSVTVIDGYSFYGCCLLTEITFPTSLLEIGFSAFRDCKQLTEITFPIWLSKIGNAAFKSCDALKTINYRGSEEDWTWVKLEDQAIPDTVTIVYNYTK